MSEVKEAVEEVEDGETPEEAVEESESQTKAESDEKSEKKVEPEIEVSEDAHELSRPAVIDLKSLLTPIPGDNPSGEYLRYDGIYDEIGEARRADDVLALGAWETDLKVAEYRKVLDLGIDVIAGRSKDLQIAAWVTEALVAEHGFAGMRDGYKLIRLLITNFWDTLYPEIDEGDEEGRANALDWIDRESADLLKKAPITAEGWGLNGYLDSKKFDIPDNLEGFPSDQQLKYTALREQAEKENRATASKWKQAVAKTNRAFCEEVEVAINECREEYKKLNLAIEEKFDRNQAPSLPETDKALTEIKSEAGKILEQKRLEEPDPSDIAEEESGSETSAGGTAGGTKGPIQSRKDALRRLSEVAAFFKQTEPHSPVSYLVNRAVSWGNMPLETWLQDVIKDQNILAQLKQTLGFNTAGESPDSTGSSGNESSDSGSSPPSTPPLQPMQ